MPFEPVASRPRLFGREPGGPPVAWAWANQQLHAAQAYWVATVDQTARPHIRPYWGCWTAQAFTFSTRSRALANIQANPQASVHLESGNEVVIVEGHARLVVDPEDLQSFVAEYNSKYDWNLHVHGQVVGDGQGATGNVVVVQASVVYGWQQSIETATKWKLATPG